MRQPLTNWDRRDAANTEIESDLGRVEAHVELALENATMEGEAELISANVELTSRLLSTAPGPIHGSDIHIFIDRLFASALGLVDALCARF